MFGEIKHIYFLITISLSRSIVILGVLSITENFQSRITTNRILVTGFFTCLSTVNFYQCNWRIISNKIFSCFSIFWFKTFTMATPLTNKYLFKHTQLYFMNKWCNVINVLGTYVKYLKYNHYKGGLWFLPYSIII